LNSLVDFCAYFRVSTDKQGIADMDTAARTASTFLVLEACAYCFSRTGKRLSNSGYSVATSRDDGCPELTPAQAGDGSGARSGRRDDTGSLALEHGDPAAGYPLLFGAVPDQPGLTASL
jgi:hypothetical protein